MAPRLQGEALVVHLFVAADGPGREADHAYLHDVWRRCLDRLGMTAAVLDLSTEPDLADGVGLLAACGHPEAAGSPHVQQALLWRVHDTFCLTVMREPDGASWTQLESDWDTATYGLSPSDGVLGSARLYLARTVDTGPPDPAMLADTVKDRLPSRVPVAPSWWERGVQVPVDFAVWEASEPDDRRALRRIVVLAGADADRPLSGWTWVTEGRTLPRLGRYLLSAAKLRHQHRVWERENPTFRQARRDADTTVDRLLDQVVDGAEASTAELVAVSRKVVGLQRGEVGLGRVVARLREMRRTVEIATANLTALGGPQTPGLFADDRALGAWLDQQLDDDQVYLQAARDRAGQVATLTDQMIRRRLQEDQEDLQRRQDRFNLGLTGVVGAILMMLAAIQSLMYKPPLPPLAIPAVVSALGALALWASLLVLRAAVPEPWWSQALVWLASGLLGATAAWVIVSVVVGLPDHEATTRIWAAVGFAVGVAAAGAVRMVRRR